MIETPVMLTEISQIYLNIYIYIYISIVPYSKQISSRFFAFHSIYGHTTLYAVHIFCPYMFNSFMPLMCMILLWNQEITSTLPSLQSDQKLAPDNVCACALKIITFKSVVLLPIYQLI